MCSECKKSINLEVPLDEVDTIFKAAEIKIQREYESEGKVLPDSPARKKLNDIVSETYDAMTFSLLKEVSELFEP